MMREMDASTNLGEEWAAFVNREGERAPLLLFLLQCRARGGEARARERLPELARMRGISLEAAREVAHFEEEVVAALRLGKAELSVCGGTWCTLSGGAALHARLQAALEALGLPFPAVRYHCLAHCQMGPNLALGATVWSAGEEGVDRDLAERHVENWARMDED